MKDITLEQKINKDFQKICKELNLREETVDGIDEIGILQNFINKNYVHKQLIEQAIVRTFIDENNLIELRKDFFNNMEI